jgi:polyhydroxyalkanoate synthase subunit PhaC
MQPHHELQRAWLPLADMMDRLIASANRSRMHALAATARLVQGRAPIEFVHGPASPHSVVADGPLARLLQYRPASRSQGRAPILIVSSLLNRYYSLDLLPELSVISLFTARGFDVFVLDWKAPGELGPDLRFEDYVDGAIASAAAQAAAEASVAQVSLLGYCMGGTLATLFAARHPEQVKALCLLATPIDFHASGPLATLTRREYFDADLLVDALGNLPPVLMQSGFRSLNPVDAAFQLARLALDAGDERRVRHLVALQSWLEDKLAFPGGVYREYIGRLYQDNALIRGEFSLGGEPIDLKKVVAPLLNVIGLRDYICAPPASRALMELVSSTEKRVLEFDTGHIGIAAGRRAYQQLWPEAVAWMEENG